MSDYNELIKNFEKIRDFTRDFFIYGYRGRGDYKDVSMRSYDNERRRIESYLVSYITNIRDAKGKTIAISSNTTAQTHNPLFKVWQAKSFTKNDCFLHFAILDILNGETCFTLSEIAEKLFNDYISKFEKAELLDTMTVRNKLNEYTKLGILKTKKNGKTVCYSLADSIILNHEIETALAFYQNILPAGFLGATLIKGKESNFIYRQIFFSQTLDDEILLDILKCITEKRLITVHSENLKNRRVQKATVIPVKILSNTKTGRRYLAFYSARKGKYSTMRIDYIKKIDALEPIDDYEQIKENYKSVHSKSFSLVHQFQYSEKLNYLKMVLHINEKDERYVLERLKREGRHGIITRLAEHTFEYFIEVPDTTEMRPWLRTFMGRIISMDASEKAVIKEFIRDIFAMAELYKEAGEADVQ